MRAAIYARYSSDLQREASIDDQLRRCRERIARDGWLLAVTYASGASRLRPAYQDLLAGARSRRYDVLVAEALDRLSRDQEDVAALYKRLAFAGIKIVTLAEGEISELHVGLKGTMNALFLKDLALKTHRGLEGRVRQGRSAGGRVYGYAIVREADARGEPIRGGRAINEAEAAVVRRIFQAFASGRSPAAIARELNAQGIGGPDGRPWQGGAITGHSRRRNGILRNELYIGRRVWNRQHFVKDPVGGKRIPRVNPEAEWIVEPAPEVRIVEDALWQAVAARLEETEHSPRVRKLRASRFWERRRPGHLLTGLVRCGCCGGRVTAVGGDYLACAAARKMGTCDNRLGLPRPALEGFILDTLKDHLMAPELVREFIAEFTAEANRQRREQEVQTEHKRRELAEVTRRLDGLAAAIEDGLRTPGLKQRLERLEQRQAALQDELAAETPPAPRLHPNLAELYRRKVAELAQALEERPRATRPSGCCGG
jgi:DNA invertase Pin-like site-specific DNA recombinase